MSTEGEEAGELLACPRCARTHPASERFCAECGMPLVRTGGAEEEPVTDSHGRARKVKPQYAGGDLVKVGWARNQAEAELIQGLLLEEGIPSVQRRTQGFDVPDFLAGGPRDVLVAESAYGAARELLEVTEAGTAADGEGIAALDRIDASPGRLAAWVLVAAGGAGAIVYGLYRLTA